MEILQLTLLGNPEIRRSGVPINNLRSKKAQALLTAIEHTEVESIAPTD